MSRRCCPLRDTVLAGLGRLALAFVLIGWAGHALASAPVAALMAPGSLAGHLSVLDDPEGKLDPEEAKALFGEGAFTPLPGFFSAWLSQHTYWLAFQLAPPPGKPEDWVLRLMPAFLDDLRVFTATGPGRETIVENQAMPRIRHAFLIDEPGGRTSLVLIRLSGMRAKVLIGRAVPLETFVAQQLSSQIWSGIYLGVTLLFAFIHLIAGVALRNRVALFSAGYFVSVAGVAAVQIGFFPSLTGINSQSANELFASIALPACSILGAALCGQILDLKPSQRILRTIYLAAPLVLASVYCLIGTRWYVPVSNNAYVIAALIAILTLAIIIRRWIRHEAEGDLIFFGLGLATLIVAFTIQRLDQTGTLPVSSFSVFGFLIGSAGQLAFLNLALAWQLYRFAADRQAARQALVDAQSGLETTVAERTATLTAVQQELTRALADERMLRANQRNMLAMLAHEVRTPLATIVRSAQMLLYRGDGLSAAQKARIVNMQARAGDAAGLVSRFLAAGPLERGELEAEPIPLSAAAVEGIVRSLELDRYEAARIRISTNDPDGSILADPMLLKLALSNIIGNALKFAPARSPVRVRIEAGPERFEITVDDEGPGFPVDDIVYLATPFFRGTTRPSLPGMGLGLYLARRAAEAHRGTLWIGNHAKGGRVMLYFDRRST
ncbi:sensor histidine kinase [Kaistia dalseonensis]|uniref:histidine kinase n=1 Tax=Kaistia dalseonensis TaxID=410840 RepID=A0ABU0H0M5_9HYPH|nr:sensor histidine kinase [Kaistia dalseonensis]MCX5493302.1 sensor histidine kinase [Kaistia dalseonensis]MDQ0435859.1 signal transduction histidine kinase [Kaistia dalseonensis]